jgi:hypothetical protein
MYIPVHGMEIMSRLKWETFPNQDAHPQTKINNMIGDASTVDL